MENVHIIESYLAVWTGGSDDAHFQINCKQIYFLGIRNLFFLIFFIFVNRNTAIDMLSHGFCGQSACVLLLLIVVLAVEQAVPAVTRPGERA